MKIISHIQLPSSKGGYISCSMDDGSLWFCDIDGTNWRKISISDDELQTLFNKFFKANEDTIKAKEEQIKATDFTGNETKSDNQGTDIGSKSQEGDSKDESISSVTPA